MMKTPVYITNHGYSGSLWYEENGLYTGGGRGPWTLEQVKDYYLADVYRNRQRGRDIVEAIEAYHNGNPKPLMVPDNLKQLYLSGGGGTLPVDIKLPDSLKELFLDGGTLPVDIKLPYSLEILRLGGGTLPADIKLPNSLIRLYLGGGTLPADIKLPDNLKII